MDFPAQLRSINVSPQTYLSEAKARAKAAGYNVATLRFSTRPNAKLEIMTPEGKCVQWGKPTYGDFLIWSELERQGKVEKGYAKQKQRTFHASHSRMKGAWRDDPFSPNMLALTINW